MDTTNRRILVIDDDPSVLDAYRAILLPDMSSPASRKLSRLLTQSDAIPASPEFILLCSSKGAEGVRQVKESLKQNTPFAVAFIDVRMPPGRDGVKIATEIRRLDPHLEIVIVTAFSDHSREEIVRAVGTPDKLLLLRKPFDPEEVFQLAFCLSDKWNLASQARTQAETIAADTARFHQLATQSREWVWEIDADGTFTHCSPSCETLYGYRPDELLGKNAREIFIPEEERGEQQALHETILKSKKPTHAIQRHVIHKDGAMLDIETTFAPVIVKGKAVGIRGLSRDISDRCRAERALRESLSTSRSLLSTPVDAVLLIAPNGTIIEANETARREFGATQENLHGLTLWRLLPEPFAKHCRQNTAAVVRAKEAIRTEDRVGNKWYDTVFSPLRDETGAVSQIAIWARDKSEMKGLELRLELKTRELIEVNNALKVLLQQSTEAIAEHERKVHENLHRLVFPYLERLRDKYPDDEIQLYINVAMANLEKINSTFSLAISSRLKGLTPRELQVAELLKQGKNTKEIAILLKLSSRTVEFYRDKLRIKLGIKNKKENLRSHLSSLG